MLKDKHARQRAFKYRQKYRFLFGSHPKGVSLELKPPVARPHKERLMIPEFHEANRSTSPVGVPETDLLPHARLEPHVLPHGLPVHTIRVNDHSDLGKHSRAWIVVTEDVHRHAK